MADGFEVDLDALEKAASGVNGTLDEVYAQKVSSIPHDPPAIGHGELADTLSDFLSRWQRGVDNLGKDGQEIAGPPDRERASLPTSRDRYARSPPADQRRAPGHRHRPGGALMAELGQTTDPKALIPGDPETIHRTRAALRAYGDVLHLAGEGLKRIDTDAGWKGEAGDAFRGVFHGQPGKWLQAGDAFHEAATALDGYAATLAWAQGQATTAIQQWASGPANHEAAQETLNSARSQLDSAGHTAAVTVGRARDLAPPKPGLWSKVGSFFSGVGHDLEDAGATVVNDLASVGNAALHDPGSLAATAGGLLLAGVSTGGEGLGVVLDATGAGAIGGVPLNIASAAGIATGVSIAGAGSANILHDAAGPDRVNVMNSESASESSGGMSGRDIHGVGRVSERGVDVQHVWDNGDMYVQGDGQIVKVLDNGNGTHDVVVRDMANPSGQPTTVLKDATQKYIDGKISRGDWE